ncbi:hypothetical protein DFR40_2767 [Azonexus fungiphilus]|uniref:Chemoreceptor zinc-binding protein n=1 Tax=Azonexus fungiphilus TaxID=146940 RepID=A0A495VNJ8_9RHOO|nr:CZB domain-containing protein [Azonexus fungiphilus]RKT50832.1 hypothetical protein DFR40_2767 [Azonexus fungiphilus]
MTRIDIDEAIRLHHKWRRQFLNAFAGGSYADMPLSEHRSCTLACAAGQLPAAVLELDRRFHLLADEIVDLSNNGLSDSADLLLPELNEAEHQLAAALDQLR